MKNPFEGPSGNAARNEGKAEIDPDLESLAELPEKLRRLAADFEAAIEPVIVMDRKGDKATWIDAANTLYAAGKFALPRLKRGLDALDGYLQSRQK